MNAFYSTVLLTAALVTLGACDGDGPSGPEGQWRNANVHTAVIEFSMGDVVVSEGVASAAYDVPSITARVAEEGAILAFFRAQNTWTALPFTFSFESDMLEAVDYTVEFGYAFEHDEQGGFVELFYEASTPDVDPTSVGSQTVKVVVIDGFLPAKTPVDLGDYEAVMEYFGLEK